MGFRFRGEWNELPRGRLVDLFLTFEGCGVLGIRFKLNRHVRTLFEFNLVAVFIRQVVFDAYFPIQVIRPFHGDLGFFWLGRKWGLDDFIDPSRQDGARFFAHSSSQDGLTAIQNSILPFRASGI
jgi:hypothetical protein